MKIFVAVAVLLVAVSAHAQGGCTNSPENPTVVLALVGSSAAIVSRMRNRLKR